MTEDILKRLVYNEELEFERLVPKVEKVVKVKKNGSPVIVCDERKLSQWEIIVLYLVGKFFAKQLKFSETESATNKEIARAFRLKENVVSARMKELRDEKLVEQVSKGEHKISTVKLEEFLDELLNKLGL
jgi:predicted HTH transcriptional regulator